MRSRNFTFCALLILAYFPRPGAAKTITEIIDSAGDGMGNTLDRPYGIAVDDSGNAYVTGVWSDNAFKVTPEGVITEIIDSTGDGMGNTLDGPHGIAVDDSNNAFVIGQVSDNAFKITPEGVITKIIDSTGDGMGNTLDGPTSIAVDAMGNAYIAGSWNHNAFKITPEGVITKIIDSAGDGMGNTLDGPWGIAADDPGNAYVTGWNSNNAFKIAPDGVITEIINATGDGKGNTLDGPYGIAVDDSGSAYVVGYYNHNAFKITPEGVITQIIDSTGDGVGNTLGEPWDIAVDDSRNAYVMGYYSQNAFKITPDWVITEIIDSTGDGAGNALYGPSGIAVDDSGNAYVVGYSSGNAFKIDLCGIAECGNGCVEAGEVCDDAGESMVCDADCTLAVCGDGMLNATSGELCDTLANAACGGQACRRNCTCAPTTCGNGIRDSGEACDGDDDELCGIHGCRADCTCSLPRPLDATAADREQFDAEIGLSINDSEVRNGIGHSVSISGDAAIAGAQADDSVCPDNPNCNSGAAYVFHRDLGGRNMWGEAVKLTAFDAAQGDYFGASVSIGDRTAIVGAGGAYVDWRESGAAYIFERNTGGKDNWGQVVKLTPVDGGSYHAHFGLSVSINNDTAIIGAPDSYAYGAAYIFEHNTGGSQNWGQVIRIRPADLAGADDFGLSASIKGDVAIVGAPNQRGVGFHSGAAYIFQRNEGGPNNWGEVAKLTASDGSARDRFGSAVSICGDTAMVGAWENEENTGAVYVFNRNEGGANSWGETVKLTSIDRAVGDAFGYSLSLNGHTAIVGAIGENGVQPDSGTAYVLRRDIGGPDNWGVITRLRASNGRRWVRFGRSTSIDGQSAVVGAWGSSETEFYAGAAYIYYTSECGNGIVEGIEDCDDAGESASCDVDCTIAESGDGWRNEAAGEVCDGEDDDFCGWLACDSNCTCAGKARTFLDPTSVGGIRLRSRPHK